jgi:uncharacterized damage-inducible protein DinB
MGLVQNFRMMALYNQRINEQLLNCCLLLPNEVLEKETHSFFSNIVSYWNHLLFGDLILLGRLGLNEVAQLSPSDFLSFPSPKSPQDTYFRNLEDIVVTRKELDELIIQYCNNLTAEECEGFISYKTTEGELVTKEISIITQHIFNHQTHHRGQLTCVLSQFGVDYGSMDLPVIINK